MSLHDKIRRLVSRYDATLDWHQVGPTTHIARLGDLDGRIIRRNGTWWLYAIRDVYAARAVDLDPNITRAKRLAETALAEPWLLEWPGEDAPTGP